MALTTTEGILQIDLTDFYIWLPKIKPIGSDDEVTSLEFSVEEDAMVVKLKDKESVYIDAPDWWNWVIAEQLPKSLAEHETVFGVPYVHSLDGYIQITFASSNDSDPRSWAKPPACLDEWPAKRNAAEAASAPVVAVPKGFHSWLDFAVATMDVRRAQLEALEDGDQEAIGYEAMRQAAVAELKALRERG